MKKKITPVLSIFIPLEKTKHMPSGGKRENAGRKSKFSEETVKVNLTKKVPKSKVQDFKSKVNDILKSYEYEENNPTKKK